MGACPGSETCCFFLAVQPSLSKRVKFASAYPYCNGGKHELCAIYPFIQHDILPPSDLLPNGDIGRYREDDDEEVVSASGEPDMKVLVLDDSPIFAMLASNAVARAVPRADVVCFSTYAEARAELEGGNCGLIVCGYGVGEGLTAHDVRQVSLAPMVLLTGRPESEIRLPVNSRVVTKSAGPEALHAAIGAALAG